MVAVCAATTATSCLFPPTSLNPFKSRSLQNFKHSNKNFPTYSKSIKTTSKIFTTPSKISTAPNSSIKPSLNSTVFFPTWVASRKTTAKWPNLSVPSESNSSKKTKTKIINTPKMMKSIKYNKSKTKSNINTKNTQQSQLRNRRMRKQTKYQRLTKSTISNTRRQNRFLVQKIRSFMQQIRTKNFR